VREAVEEEGEVRMGRAEAVEGAVRGWGEQGEERVVGGDWGEEEGLGVQGVERALEGGAVREGRGDTRMAEGVATGGYKRLAIAQREVKAAQLADKDRFIFVWTLLVIWVNMVGRLMDRGRIVIDDYYRTWILL
jgi:hypothetical protein